MANQTVVVRLAGGLGNQMFQYAAACGLANKHHANVLIDTSVFDTYTTWPYQLDRLNIPQEFYVGVPVTGSISSSTGARLIRKLKGGVTFRDGVYREPHFHFDPLFFCLTGDEIIIDGYFQSPHYFSEVELLLRDRFKLKAPLSPLATEWASKIALSPRSVSLHVRRGDYLSDKAATVHASVDLGYYSRAVSLINDLIGDVTDFFLFSDDPDFVALAFAHLPNAHVVRSDPTAPWEDMFLMGQCQHNIIDNSSYSWWGAWLNASRVKRVIAPARWFTADKLATTNVIDLYPDDWILLK